MAKRTTTRRRGKALNDAIVASAWDELYENGYAGFTLEATARRAGTSRPVLSRRWEGRPALAAAAIGYYLQRNPVPVPDLGSLREDLSFLLRKTSERSVKINLILFSMRDYFTEMNSNLADFRRKLRSGFDRGPEAMSAFEQVLARAVERGEIDPRKLTKRIASLPLDLVRHESLMMNAPVSRRVVEEILDTIFLPLVR